MTGLWSLVDPPRGPAPASLSEPLAHGERAGLGSTPGRCVKAAPNRACLSLAQPRVERRLA